MSKFSLFKRLLGGTAPPSPPADTGFDGRDRRIKPRANARPGTRVLVVDDSSTIVAVLAKMLRSVGYEVLTAGDGETGLEIARTQAPALIFHDIVLPGISGFEALRMLRREPATRDIPVIMISGNQQATEQFYSYRIGADDFMKKPFPRSEVFARIERLLDADGVPRRVVAGEPEGAPTRVDSAAAATSIPAPVAAATAEAAPAVAADDAVPAPAAAATDALGVAGEAAVPAAAEPSEPTVPMSAEPPVEPSRDPSAANG